MRNRSADAPPRVPAYTLHKPTGLARVRLQGRDLYLGAHGTPESHAEYRRVIAEWLASGRVPEPRNQRLARDRILVQKLIDDYRRYREAAHVSGNTRAKVDEPSLARLSDLYGHTNASEFTPASLRAVMRHAAIEEALSRQYINGKLVPVIKRVFRWASREGLIDPGVCVRLDAVEPLRYGEFGARETTPVRPVDDSVVDSTIGELSPVVADMVRVQRLTGMRPGELCNLNWSEIDSSGDCWIYSPSRHKNAHRGKQRVVAIGPKAQAILMRYRHRQASLAIFSPREAEDERYLVLRRSRQSPVSPSQHERGMVRADRRESRGRRPGDRYTTDSYARAVRRACERIGIQTWTPNQLRHSRATEIRKMFGLDGASAILGNTLEVAEVYAERDLKAALEIALQTG